MNVRVTCNKCGNSFMVYLEQGDNYVYELPQYICPNDYSVMNVEATSTCDTIVEGAQS